MTREVLDPAGVASRAEQEVDENRVPGGSRRGPDRSQEGPGGDGVLTPDLTPRDTPRNTSPAPFHSCGKSAVPLYNPPRCAPGGVGAQRILKGVRIPLGKRGKNFWNCDGAQRTAGGLGTTIWGRRRSCAEGGAGAVKAAAGSGAGREWFRRSCGGAVFLRLGFGGLADEAAAAFGAAVDRVAEVVAADAEAHFGATLSGQGTEP